MTHIAMLYIHVPFCRSKCAYCDFYSTPRAQWMEPWAEAVISEGRNRLPANFSPATIYLGGGTPSSLPSELLRRTLEGLRLSYHRLEEFTIEANPEDITPGWVAAVRELGVTRVSMGVQSMQPSELLAVGRRHSPEDVERAISILRKGGVDNLSLDLIYGLPGQTLESWRMSLDAILAVRPEHLSAYLLSYEPGTRLGVMLAKGKITEASDELVSQMYRYLCAAARSAGYEHYEISNFALPGRRAIHNSRYWTGRQYIGLGPGAHSYHGGVRGYNAADLHNYIATRGLGTYITEDEDDKNQFNDLLITRLRTDLGLSPRMVAERFPAEIHSEFKAAYTELLAAGELITLPDGNIAIPERHWLLSNQIILKMIIV